MIVQGNSFRIPLKDNSVHSCVTSFPYWGLRSYGLQPLVFGGQSDCLHEWEIERTTRPNASGGPSEKQDSNKGSRVSDYQDRATYSQFCRLCSAWRGSFGLEPTMDLHIKNAVLVCREIKRVLHPTGVFWLNYGDSYATSRNGRSAADGKATGKDDRTFRDKPFSTANELPAKNLCMIPQRVAIALQADGWILRSAPQWVKRNPMPESVQDRPGTGHEYVFMLVKSERYYFDGEAARRPAARIDTQTIGGAKARNGKIEPTDPRFRNGSEQWGRTITTGENGRALRTSDFFFDSLDAYIDHLTYIRDNGGLLLDSEGLPEAFVVNPKPYKYAHYATFPTKLVEPMIKASPEKVCPECGAPWKRLMESKRISNEQPSNGNKAQASEVFARGGNQANLGRAGDYLTTTTGWQPTCKCIQKRAPNPSASSGHGFGMKGSELLELADEVAEELAPIPAVILDPFCGSGTVGYVAKELGRRFIGIDLSARYLAENALPRSEKKMSQAALGQLPLFAPGGLP